MTRAQDRCTDAGPTTGRDTVVAHGGDVLLGTRPGAVHQTTEVTR